MIFDEDHDDDEVVNKVYDEYQEDEDDTASVSYMLAWASIFVSNHFIH